MHSRVETELVKSSASNGRLFRIGELSHRTGVSPDTLRYYEVKGLMPSPTRTAGGYRQYPESAMKRVQAIRAALAIGFSIRELATVFTTRDAGGIPCHVVRALAAKKLELIEERLLELARKRDALKSVLSDWNERLRHTPTGARAGLLDALADNYPGSASVASKRLEERFGPLKGAR